MLIVAIRAPPLVSGDPTRWLGDSSGWPVTSHGYSLAGSWELEVLMGGRHTLGTRQSSIELVDSEG